MNWKFSIIILFFLLSCNDAEFKADKLEVENDGLTNYSFITSSEKLKRQCHDRLSDMVIGFYALSEEDSVRSIYHFEGNLFANHYDQSENDNYEKYAVIIDYKDTSETFFLQ